MGRREQKTRKSVRQKELKRKSVRQKKEQNRRKSERKKLIKKLLKSVKENELRRRRMSVKQRRSYKLDGVGLKQIATSLGAAVVAGSVLTTPLPSTTVQSISVPSPLTTTTTSFSTPSLRSNSSEFLKMYKRSDNTRKEVANRINAVPQGYYAIEKDYLSWDNLSPPPSS